MSDELDLFTINVESGRRLSRILVIDDNDFEVSEPLRRSGFQITHMKDIDTIEVVDPYHIVACDIQGVGKAFNSAIEGAFLIQQIKARKPDKYVIAFSRGVFNLSFQQAISAADVTILKDSDVSIWAHDLDQGIRKIWSPKEIWIRASAKLVELKVSSKKINELERKFIESVKSRSSLTNQDVQRVLLSRGFLGNLKLDDTLSSDFLKATAGIVSFAANAATLLDALGGSK